MTKEDDAVFARELELLKKMNPAQLRAQVQLELSMMPDYQRPQGSQREENAKVEVMLPTYDYYPSQKYVDKNLKAESVQASDLVYLASAQRKAEKAGVLSPEVAKYFLANALVEGRFSKTFKDGTASPEDVADFGVNSNIFHGSPAIKKIVKSLGLEESTKPPVIDDTLRANLKAAGVYGISVAPKDSVVFNVGDSPALNATYAAAIMGIKSAGKTPEEAIKAWNGQGPGAQKHLEKVQEAHRMLANPKNAVILKAYQKALITE